MKPLLILFMASISGLSSLLHAERLAVDLKQTTAAPVQAGFKGWFVGVPGYERWSFLTTTIDGYDLTIVAGNDVSAFQSGANARMNGRDRVPHIPNAGAFTQSALMMGRFVSLGNPIHPAEGKGTGRGLYLRIENLVPDTEYVIQVWAVDQKANPPVLRNGYVYGFDATREAPGYDSLPMLGHYVIANSPDTISDNDAYSISGTITSDGNGTIIYKSISNIECSGMISGFTLVRKP